MSRLAAGLDRPDTAGKAGLIGWGTEMDGTGPGNWGIKGIVAGALFLRECVFMLQIGRAGQLIYPCCRGCDGDRLASGPVADGVAEGESERREMVPAGCI